MPSKPRTWPRLIDPPPDVTKVRSDSNTVWTRMDDYYWTAPGWPHGVNWAQVLRWGPVTEMSDNDDNDE